MKKLFCLLVLSSLLALTTMGQVNPAYKVAGTISSNTENVNKEADPIFASISRIPEAMKKSTQGVTEAVSGIANGMVIVTKIVDKMIQREYSFSLLSSHKYMVNDCLGLKVSSGQFDLKFA